MMPRGIETSTTNDFAPLGNTLVAYATLRSLPLALATVFSVAR